MVRKRLSNSKHNSLDHDELRDEPQRRGMPMGKARTRLQMLHQLARHELIEELCVSESED